MERNTGAWKRGFGHFRPRMNAVAACLAMSVLAGALLSGCAGTGEAARAGGDAAAAPPSTSRAATGPSDAARMICSAQTRASVAAALAMSRPPEPRDDWTNQTYRCTYELDEGTLLLTVNELPDAATALHDFEDLKRDLGQVERIEGLASLGLPAYKTPSGTVIFAKDNMILQVDATGMRPELGPNLLSPTDFAYQIATNVLACWKAHH